MLVFRSILTAKEHHYLFINWIFPEFSVHFGHLSQFVCGFVFYRFVLSLSMGRETTVHKKKTPARRFLGHTNRVDSTSSSSSLSTCISPRDGTVDMSRDKDSHVRQLFVFFFLTGRPFPSNLFACVIMIFEVGTQILQNLLHNKNKGKTNRSLSQ